MNTTIGYPFMNGICLSCSNCDTSEGNGTKIDVREKLVELLEPHMSGLACEYEGGSCELTSCRSCNARNIADYLIANGVTVQEWVSVDDRLPNDNGKLQAFLVCRNQPSATSGKVLIQTEFFTNTFSGIDNVTHWMSLPKPPKGE